MYVSECYHNIDKSIEYLEHFEHFEHFKFLEFELEDFLKPRFAGSPYDKWQQFFNDYIGSSRFWMSY
jgi:hypothetical protein